MKHIGILGSTGSIGRQTLEVVEANPSLFSIDVLAAKRHSALIIEQVRRFMPRHLFITDAKAAESLAIELSDVKTEVHSGWNDWPDVCRTLDFVLGAISGAAGILPTLTALEAGLPIGLANKETLVSAGDLVDDTLSRYGGSLIPVDSEHSAIFQCLQGQDAAERLIITASGGPFRTTPSDALQYITPQDALNHPNWQMGPKITIDSATLMNKGLEVIEAHRLFHIPIDQIDVVVHPESIVHSMVEFKDGSILGQMGLPDMRLPIQYALNWPNRLHHSFERLQLTKIGALHFEEPRWDAFPALRLAYDMGRMGGIMPAVMNAANEEAVAAFLENRIRFTDIMTVVSQVLSRFEYQPIESLDMLLSIDAQARRLSQQLIKERRKS